MTTTFTTTGRIIRAHAIRYMDANGNKWTRLARPGMLDTVLKELQQEQPSAVLITIDTQFKA